MRIPPIYESDRVEHGLDLHAMIIETGLDTYLGSETDRANLIDSLTPEAFTDFVVRVHEAATGRPQADDIMISRLNGIEADEHQPTRFVLSAPEDKQGLLDVVLESAQTTEIPGLKALVIGYGLNIVHPFNDGNGRTARALYYMLSRDFKPDQTHVWSELIDANGDQLLPLNASVFTAIIEDQMMLQSDAYFTNAQGDPVAKLETCVADLAVAENPRAFLDELSKAPLRRTYDEQREIDVIGILDDALLRTMIPYSLIHDKNSRAARDATITIQGHGYFQVDQFLRNATDKDMDNIQSLHRAIKFAYAKELIRSIAWLDNKTMPVAMPTNEYGLLQRSLPEIAHAYTERTITYDTNYQPGAS